MIRLNTSSEQQKASGLVLVMWSVGFLSLTITGLFSYIMLGLENSIIDEADFRARQLAESGIALASHPAIKPGDPLLIQRINDTESFEVTISDETSRLNLNFLLFSQRTDILENLLRIWGLRTNEINAVIDCLADWVDDNNLRRLNGAEAAYYESIGLIGLPPNRPIETLDEIELTKNWNLVVEIRPNWRDYFTQFGDGRININDANSEILQALFNCSAEQAQAIIAQRNGKDGVPHTKDDMPIRDINQLRILANLNEAQILTAINLVSYDGTIRRIKSRGIVGEYARTIETIMQVPSAPLRYYDWREY